jgi:hypothetical protein
MWAEAESKEKHGMWDPMPELTITSPYVDSRVDSSTVPWATLRHTVKRVDEVVRHPHLVTQDQNTQVSNKVTDIPEENFTINIELFRQTFTNVELLR